MSTKISIMMIYKISSHQVTQIGRDPDGFPKINCWCRDLMVHFSQLYYASPAPFWLQEFFLACSMSQSQCRFDDTKARSVHLALLYFF